MEFEEIEQFKQIKELSEKLAEKQSELPRAILKLLEACSSDELLTVLYALAEIFDDEKYLNKKHIEHGRALGKAAQIYAGMNRLRKNNEEENKANHETWNPQPYEDEQKRREKEYEERIAQMEREQKDEIDQYVLTHRPQIFTAAIELLKGALKKD